MSVTCGIDWAERHHDVALVDDRGTTIAKKRIDTGLKGFTELLALIAEHGGDPGAVPVAIETDKNLIVVSPGGRVHGVSDQPSCRGALSGTPQPGRREVRPR
jgi:hypothetical protein